MRREIKRNASQMNKVIFYIIILFIEYYRMYVRAGTRRGRGGLTPD